MASYYRRKGSRARRKKKMRRLTLAALFVILLVVIIIVVVSCGSDGKEDRKKEDPSATVAAEALSTSAVEPSATPTVEPTAEPTPEPTPEVSAEVAARVSNRPTANEGFLPIFKKADTDEKIIAITVDDCFQIDNLKQMIQLALDYDGKLTIFPIGEQAMRSSHAPVLKAAWEAGMELENHTYSHSVLYKSTDESLATQIYLQNYALNYILGGEYEVHFLRPGGGDGRYDQRIHAYCMQMGYKGIAHWTYSGSSSDNLKNEIKPGAIYLFHCTDKDLKTMQWFIPMVSEMGYKLVTLNEMFGYEDNAFTPMEIPNEMPEIPPLEPYEKVPVEYGKKLKYAYGILEMQTRLSELGYLDDNPDGIYGPNTKQAVADFQMAAGLEITGIASVETQQRLNADDAPRFAGHAVLET